MASDYRWSMVIGRLGGGTIRVHAFFWMLAASTLLFAFTSHGTFSHQENLLVLAFLSLIVLAVGVLLHELGHWWAVRRLGGSMPALIIGPVSGMGRITPPADPRKELLVHLAGPAVNLLMALVGLALLALSKVPGITWLHPIHHQSWIDGGQLTMIQLMFTINWLLCLINLSPSLMFDGGRAIRAGLLWKWPGMDRFEAERWVASATRIVSAALLLIVILSWQWGWVIDSLLAPLALFSIFLFFSSEPYASSPHPGARRDRQPGYESAVEATLRQMKNSSPPSPARSPGAEPPLLDEENADSWESLVPLSESFGDDTERNAELPVGSENQEREEEASEERRMDELLARVHEHGIDSLNGEEHAFLQMVSARFRARRHHVS
jgi:Zn-dependent protease